MLLLWCPDLYRTSPRPRQSCDIKNDERRQKYTWWRFTGDLSASCAFRSCHGFSCLFMSFLLFFFCSLTILNIHFESFWQCHYDNDTMTNLEKEDWQWDRPHSKSIQKPTPLRMKEKIFLVSRPFSKVRTSGPKKNILAGCMTPEKVAKRKERTGPETEDDRRRRILHELQALARVKKSHSISCVVLNRSHMFQRFFGFWWFLMVLTVFVCLPVWVWQRDEPSSLISLCNFDQFWSILQND